jgi:hypothetical protein
MRRAWVLVAVGALAGCGGGSSEGGGASTTGTSDLAGVAADQGVDLVQCVDLSAPVDVDAVASTGCLSGDTVEFAATYDCADGRRAVLIAGRMGVEDGEWVDAGDGGPWDLC